MYSCVCVCVCVCICQILYTHTWILSRVAFSPLDVCAGQIVKTKINLVVKYIYIYICMYVCRQTKDSSFRDAIFVHVLRPESLVPPHFVPCPSRLVSHSRTDKYAMLVWLGPFWQTSQHCCCHTKSHYICFILFAATSSFSSSAAFAACPLHLLFYFSFLCLFLCCGQSTFVCILVLYWLWASLELPPTSLTPPASLSSTYLLLTACLVIVLVWPFVSKLVTMDFAKWKVLYNKCW